MKNKQTGKLFGLILCMALMLALLAGCGMDNKVFVIHPDGTADFLSVKRGPPTGAMGGVFYPCQKAKVERGSQILVYTDGVTESANANRVLYGTERVPEFLNGRRDLALKPLLEALRADIAAFADGAPQSDDITMLALTYNGPGKTV